MSATVLAVTPVMCIPCGSSIDQFVHIRLPKGNTLGRIQPNGGSMEKIKWGDSITKAHTHSRGDV